MRTGLHIGSVGLVILILQAAAILAAGVVLAGTAMVLAGLCRSWLARRCDRSADEQFDGEEQ